MALPKPEALQHTCFLVRDLEGTAKRLSDDLGIEQWNIWTIEPDQCMVHGQESPYSFRIALATVGGSAFELITPHSGRSVYEEHLEKHGEGFHHICLVYSSLDAVQQAKAELRQQGRKLIQEGSSGGVFDFAYFDFPEIGSAVEVLYLDDSKLPPAEAVIQSAS